jgi:hypothetical protein
MKMKRFFFITVYMLALTGSATYAQVTIGVGNTPNAGALLDLKNNDNTVNATGGINFPRVNISNFNPATDAAFAASIGGTGNWNRTTHIGLVVYNTGTPAGLHVWTGTKWEKTGASPWNISGTANPALLNTDSIYQMGNVSIGTSGNPIKSAILNVEATDKGVLLPRIPLASATDVATIPNPTTGLLVYNTGTNAAFPVKGYMFWNGVEWRLISSATSDAPFATLSCGQAVLDPDQVIIGGTPISPGSVLKIPYTVGNGGTYNSAVIYTTDYPSSTVHATITSNAFANGSGHLTFNVSGMPTAAQATPTGITFNLQPFYDANPSLDNTLGCKTVTVGQEVKADILKVAIMDNLKYTTDANLPAYATQLTTPDGKFSVRVVIASRDVYTNAGAFGTDSEYGMNLQIRNNTNSTVAIAGQFNWQWGGSGGTGSNKLKLQPGKWSGDRASNVSEAYAVYVDGNSASNFGNILSPTSSSTNSAKFVYWGNEGVYAGGRPERRTYSWTINDNGQTKTAYILTFSSSASDPDAYARNSTCPGGVCSQTKVFMMIDQITAP